jgi:hypothetical protein
MEGGRQSGQAAVEWVGGVVMVALLVAALVAWGARELRPPERPPDPVSALTRPLAGAGRDLGAAARSVPGLAALPARDSHGRGIVASAAGRIARGGRAGAALAADMGSAFGARFVDRLRARARALIASPPAVDDLVPDPRAVTAEAVVRDVVRRVRADPGAVVGYVRVLSRMRARDAAVKAAGDAGELTADAAVEAAEFLVQRLILRGLGRLGRGRAGGGEVAMP